MSYALPISRPQISRRGACPSLDEPMRTGDGLLARLRIPRGRLTPAQLAAIAALARQDGNGLMEITARGNLQVRGLSEESRWPFAQAIEAITLVERGLVVETSPLAGEDPDEIADPLPLAKAIRALAPPLNGRLAPKVAVIVDGGGQIGLASLKADIRLTALAGGFWAMSVGGGGAEAISEQDAMARVGSVLGQLAELGPGARGSDLAGQAVSPLPRGKAVVGTFRLRSGSATGITLPFGGASAQAMEALAGAAERDGVASFCLAPRHGLLAVDAGPGFFAAAVALGFITTDDDPRIRVSACIGSEGCASGYIAARTIAAQLASHVAPGHHLHVSGCAKGCAHPRRADVTLVGRLEGYGLVIGGTAGDTPRAVLRAAQLESALAGQG